VSAIDSTPQSDKDLNLYKSGNSSFAAEGRTIVLENAKEVTNLENVLLHRVMLFSYFIPLDMHSGSGGGKSMSLILSQSIEDK
jgi:hypothetical protein